MTIKNAKKKYYTLQDAKHSLRWMGIKLRMLNFCPEPERAPDLVAFLGMRATLGIPTVAPSDGGRSLGRERSSLVTIPGLFPKLFLTGPEEYYSRSPSPRPGRILPLSTEFFLLFGGETTSE